jgi:hypothetical protein
LYDTVLCGLRLLLRAGDRQGDDDLFADNPNDGETAHMKDHAATKTAQIRLARRSPEYWRVTIDHPPLNLFGPEMLSQVGEIIMAIETDKKVKVVVFDSAVEIFLQTLTIWRISLLDPQACIHGPKCWCA